MLASHTIEENDEQIPSRIMDRLGPRPPKPEGQRRNDDEMNNVDFVAVDDDKTVCSETLVALASDSNASYHSSSDRTSPSARDPAQELTIQCQLNEVQYLLGQNSAIRDRAAKLSGADILIDEEMGLVRSSLSLFYLVEVLGGY